MIILHKNDSLEKRINLTVLFDLYGPILTDRQRKVFELHEMMDFSLGEIADEMGISRQAAYDLLQRATDRLIVLDRELSISGRIRDYDRCFEDIRKLSNRWQKELPGPFISQLEKIIDSGGKTNV